MVKIYTATLMKGTNDVSRGESRKVMKLHEKMSCTLQEVRIWFDPAILTICTVPYNMMFDQHAMEMNEKVRNINGEIRQTQQRSVLPVRLLDVDDLMEQSLPCDASSCDGIHLDTAKGTEWLNGVFQRHINQLESDLIEMAQFTLGPPPIPPFYAPRSLSSRLGARAVSRDSSRSSRTRQPGSTPMEAEESGVFYSPEFAGLIGSGGGRQEDGENSRGEQDAIFGEDKRVGSGELGVQRGVSGGLGTQGCVTRGFESTPLCGLVKSP